MKERGSHLAQLEEREAWVLERASHKARALEKYEYKLCRGVVYCRHFSFLLLLIGESTMANKC